VCCYGEIYVISVYVLKIHNIYIYLAIPIFLLRLLSSSFSHSAFALSILALTAKMMIRVINTAIAIQIIRKIIETTDVPHEDEVLLVLLLSETTTLS
jgi:hypothetical protein